MELGAGGAGAGSAGGPLGRVAGLVDGHALGRRLAAAFVDAAHLADDVVVGAVLSDERVTGEQTVVSGGRHQYFRTGIQPFAC